MKNKGESYAIPIGNWDHDGNWTPDLNILDSWPVVNQEVSNLLNGFTMEPHNHWSNGDYRLKIV